MARSNKPMVYYGLNKFLESILVGIDRISSQDVYDICFRVIESTTQHMFFLVGYMEQTIRGCQDFFRFGRELGRRGHSAC